MIKIYNKMNSGYVKKINIDWKYFTITNQDSLLK